MKNLFKSMMLVAVAAMAFTACQKDNGELNEVKRTVEFTATIGEDTRSGFNGTTTDAEGKTYYQSKWDGEEMLIFLAESTSSYPVVDANGKFSVTLNENDHYADIYSPAGGWEYNYISGVGYGYYPIVPETQTPRTNSVDPAAHILSAIDVPVDGSENVSFTFKHAVAYGKMTVNTPAEFEITKVVLNLKGINQYEEDDDLTYTINATNVENNEFWFATEPLKVSEFTITAHDSDGKLMAKTVTVSEGKLLFQTGHVSTFSVSNLTEQEAPKPVEFTSVVYNYYKVDKQLTFTSVDMGELKLNFYPDDTNGGDYLNVGHYYSPSSLYVGSLNYAYFKPVDGSEIKISYVSADISIVDGKYMFVFYVEAGDYVFDGMYHGIVDGLSIPDTRTKLATPVLSYEMSDSMTAIVSWEAINGAVGYKVACNCGIDITTTDTSIELTFPEYGTHDVFVTALAADDDKNYKNSETATATLTLKDPNVLADYTFDTLSWNSTYSRFELTGGGNGITQFYLNSADMGTDHNWIKPGDYTYAGNTVANPAQGAFSLRYLLGSGAGSSHYVYDASMNVSFADSEYKIIITIINAGNGNVVGKTFGYKGLPEGWVAPADSGDDNTGEGGEVDDTSYGDGTSANPYIYTCNVVKSGGYYRLSFTSQAAGAQPLYLETNSDNATEIKEGAITSDNNWFPSACKYANGSITTAWDESTISFTHVGDTIYSFDEIKISTFNGYVYYKCESVNLY